MTEIDNISLSPNLLNKQQSIENVFSSTGIIISTINHIQPPSAPLPTHRYSPLRTAVMFNGKFRKHFTTQNPPRNRQFHRQTTANPFIGNRWHRKTMASQKWQLLSKSDQCWKEVVNTWLKMLSLRFLKKRNGSNNIYWRRSMSEVPTWRRKKQRPSYGAKWRDDTRTPWWPLVRPWDFFSKIPTILSIWRFWIF